jgi:hypothetical protein
MEVSGKLHALTALSRGRAPSIHCTGEWMGPRAAPDITEKRNMCYPCRGSHRANASASSYSMFTGLLPRGKADGALG